MSNTKVFSTLGASSHSKESREINDYYATDPIALDLLLEVEEFEGVIYEPHCGEGHLVKRLQHFKKEVIASDLIDRGQGYQIRNFLTEKPEEHFDHIIANPPYKDAMEHVYRALELLPENGKCAMFLKLLFMESKKRKKLFLEHPPKTIYVSSSRITCAKNGNFDGTSGAVAYAWYVWEKNFKGNTIVKWIN